MCVYMLIYIYVYKTLMYKGGENPHADSDYIRTPRNSTEMWREEGVNLGSFLSRHSSIHVLVQVVT